jgi:haloacid dehalogenase-like hydrolase
VANTVAVVFDFDDTLVPDSTSLLLKQHGIDPAVFWGTDLKALLSDGYDPTLGFLKLFLDIVGEGRPLGLLSNAGLMDFGQSLDKQFHEGLPELFEDLRRIGMDNSIAVEFYIISGGLQAVIEGSEIVRKYFKAVYGCVLAETGQPPRLDHVKRAINFTEKTRYIFEINKGVTPKQTLKKPYAVNEDVPKRQRPVPLKNMIYVGDGLTDIPCFSLIKSNGGIAFGVFDPADEAKAKRALLKFLTPGRVISMNAPRYGKTQELGALLRAAVGQVCTRILVERGSAEPAEDDE